jgi:hypothetical protein
VKVKTKKKPREHTSKRHHTELPNRFIPDKGKETKPPTTRVNITCGWWCNEGHERESVVNLRRNKNHRSRESFQ